MHGTSTYSRRSALKLCLLGAPSLAKGGALQDGEPVLANYNVLDRVMAMLRRHPDDVLRPHTYVFGGEKYAYYLNQIGFVGRSQTIVGPRNIVFCGYTRSAAYIDRRTGPAHGHRYLLFLTDALKLDFFGRTEERQKDVTMDGTVLTIGNNKLDLKTEAGFQYLREIRPL